MALQLSSFFVTQNFDAAWSCYQDWQAFQQSLNLHNQVGLAGCRINGRICWDVCITQELHDARVAQAEGWAVEQPTQNLWPNRLGLFVAVPLAVVGLSGGLWLSSTSQYEPSEAEICEEQQHRRNRKNADALVCQR